jgi:hypothetical protein
MMIHSAFSLNYHNFIAQYAQTQATDARAALCATKNNTLCSNLQYFFEYVLIIHQSY